MTEPINTRLIFQDIVKIVAVLEMLSGETMRAGDDATLRKFQL
jgi:hypothetical protein